MKRTLDLGDGYEPLAPTQEVHDGDADIVAKTKCRHCGGEMQYDPWYSKATGSCRSRYRAFAVCVDCKREVEF